MYNIHQTYTRGVNMTFTQFRLNHNLTKQAVCKAMGFGRCRLNTIEQNIGKAYAHDVLKLARYYQSIDSSISIKALLNE